VAPERVALKKPLVSRREALRLSVIGAGGILAAPSLVLAGADCDRTTPQTEGPFHPAPRVDGVVEDHRILKMLDKNTDLTFVNGGAQKAAGQVLYIFGTVTDEECAPLADARVEIWQACHTGKYNHEWDSSEYALDPNFQYWGIAKTNAKGKYVFKTILPGAYRNDPEWVRPPHIHYKVKKAGFQPLTTQQYFDSTDFQFEGVTYGPNVLAQWNNDDMVFDEIPCRERERVTSTVKVAPPEMGLDAGAKYCRFNISLEK
jgi:protocatechuate 3,4-dioxygenase beta subunit